MLTKEQILDTLCPNQFVSEASISRLVSETRQVLNADVPGTKFVQTVRGKGFRFVEPVFQSEAAGMARNDIVSTRSGPQISLLLASLRS